MKIWLVGMMGSGKTSAGALAAAGLGVPFLDTDQLVAEKVGKTIAELWSDEGEEAFRSVERAVVTDVEASSGIVATGGGVVLDELNRAALARSGTVVWLEASPSALASRVSGSAERPLLETAGEPAVSVLARTLADRSWLYADVAEHRVDTEVLDVEAVAQRIQGLWKS